MSVSMKASMTSVLPELQVEPTAKRIRAIADGAVVADSTHALLVWEPRRVVASWAVPETDLRATLGAAGSNPRRPGTRVICYPSTQGGRSSIRRCHPASIRRTAPPSTWSPRRDRRPQPRSGPPTRPWPDTSCWTSPPSTNGGRKMFATSRTRGIRTPASTRSPAHGTFALNSQVRSWPSRTGRYCCSRR